MDETRYEQVKTDIEIREVQSVPIPMANRQLMIKLKQSRRPQDQIDLHFCSRLMIKMRNRSRNNARRSAFNVPRRVAQWASSLSAAS
jgi:hypothetical protein